MLRVVLGNLSAIGLKSEFPLGSNEYSFLQHEELFRRDRTEPAKIAEEKDIPLLFTRNQYIYIYIWNLHVEGESM